MQTLKASRRPTLLLVVGIVLVIGGVAALVFTLAQPSGSNSSKVSSLSSVVSSLNQVVSSQSSVIAALQSSSGPGVTSTVTSTAISTTSVSASGSITTVTTATTRTSTATVTTPTTITSTVTVVSTTVLSVSEPSTVSLTGQLTIPGGNGSGTLELTIANTGNDPIIGATIMIPSGNDTTVDLCSASCNSPVIYDGALISSNNPLPAAGNVVTELTTQQGEVGGTYTISVTVQFADGTTQIPTIDLVAGS